MREAKWLCFGLHTSVAQEEEQSENVKFSHEFCDLHPNVECWIIWTCRRGYVNGLKPGFEVGLSSCKGWILLDLLEMLTVHPWVVGFSWLKI